MVLQHAIEILRDRDASRELWLRKVAVPAYEEYLAHPSRAIPFDDVFSELAEDLECSHAAR